MTTKALEKELTNGNVPFKESDTDEQLRKAVKKMRTSRGGSLLKKMMKSIVKRTAKKIVKAAIGF